MYSVLFELVEDPEDLGITAEWLNETDNERDYEYVEMLPEDKKQAILNNLADAFGYDPENIMTNTESLNGVDILKIRFTQVDDYFKESYKAFRSFVKKMDFETFVRCDPESSLRSALRNNFTLVYDPSAGYVLDFDEWLRVALAANKTYATEWRYVGKIFKYYD